MIDNFPIKDLLARAKVVAVLTVERPADGPRVCEALMRGGIRAVEITFRAEAAAEVIAACSREFPELLIGAGTVLSSDNLARAIDAGAKFAVAPGLNPAVAGEAVRRGLPFMPGVATPTEIEAALAVGCRHLKFFPAGALGGPAFLKNIAAPYRHLGVRFMPTGGVSAKTIAEWLAVPEVICVGGTWLGTAADIAAGAWHRIEELAREAVRLSEEARP